jgi:protein SCO1/2
MRWLRHPLFAPVLVLAVLAWGTLVLVFLLVGPRLGPWATSLLTACFGWNAATRAYRLDMVLLVVLQPPLFVAVVAFFYAEELRAFLARLGGRVAGGAAALGFVTASLLLVLGGEVRGGPPTAAPPVPMREGRLVPRIVLQDHRGRPFDLGEPKGRPVALTFVYGDCHAACPLLVATLEAARARVGERAVFAAVTLDPRTDDVAALAAHAARWGLGESWHLLTGEPALIDELRHFWTVRTVRQADGSIGHDNVLVLIDGRGRAAFTYRGLAVGPDELARVLVGLAAEHA